MEKRNIFALFRIWLKRQGGQGTLRALLEQMDGSGDGKLDMNEVLGLLQKVNMRRNAVHAVHAIRTCCTCCTCYTCCTCIGMAILPKLDVKQSTYGACTFFCRAASPDSHTSECKLAWLSACGTDACTNFVRFVGTACWF